MHVHLITSFTGQWFRTKKSDRPQRLWNKTLRRLNRCPKVSESIGLPSTICQALQDSTSEDELPVKRRRRFIVPETDDEVELEELEEGEIRE